MNPNGPERRTDDTSVRLALLEQNVLVADVRHKENKKSLAAVHKRLTEIKSEVASEVKTGLDAILKKMDDKNVQCAEHGRLLAEVQSNIHWIDRWALGISAAVTTIGGWIFAHGDKAKP